MWFGKYSRFFLTISVTLSMLSACGSGQERDESDPSSSQAKPFNPSEVEPNIHINVPPPEGKSSETSAALPPNTAENFFNGKEAYDDFSDPLKDRIYETYSVDPSQNLQGNGHGYYNTLMGRTAPILYRQTAQYKIRAEKSGDVQALEAEGEGVDEGCDPTGTFLCLDTPQDGFETVHPGVDVIGKIDLTQLAVFSANDPVAVISVFNNSGGGASAEIPVMPADVQSTDNPDIGKFSAAVGLSGAGHFTIVVSAFRTLDGGSNELFSIMVTGTRLEAPEIEFAQAVPSPINKLAAAGHETDPVENNAVIASEFLNLKVKLLTAGGAGIQIKFNDSNENDELQSSVVALPTSEGAETFAIGKVPLHQGINKIKVIARSPALDAVLGDAAPPPSIVEFTVFNADGGPRLKILSPAHDGVVTQTSATGQLVDLKFCYTFIPSKTTGNSGGSASLPTINDECKTGNLGFDPEVMLNGIKIVGNDQFNYDSTQGIFTVKLEPTFGVNVYEIKSVDQINGSNEQTRSQSYHAGAIAFGSPMKLIENGQISSGIGTMTARGLNLDLDKKLIEGDVKKVLLKFLNRPQTSDLVLGIFKKTATTPGYVCYELEQQLVSGGDTSIEFDPETFTLGSVEVKEIAPSGDGTLHVSATINGMHGDAELRAVDGREVTYYGQDIGFLPLRIDIAKLEIKLAVAFTKKADQDLNLDGAVDEKDERSVLDLRKIEGQELITVVGDGELGNYVTVDPSRNPHAAGAQFLDEQQGLIKRQFKTSLEGTFLCGIEEGQNHVLTGALGKGVLDLTKLTGYNANIFRLAFNFELLGKAVGLDIAYNILLGDIRFDSEGIHILNAPLRFNPGPTQLTKLAADYAEGIIGAVSRFFTSAELEPSQNNTTENHQAALGLGEDAINQVLSAAVLSGLVDLDVDANFYSKNKITPTKSLAPMGGSASRLAPEIDVNLDGRTDSEDALSPLLLRVKADKRVTPMLTFLSASEVQRMAQEVIARQGPAGTPDPQGTDDPVAAPGPSIVDAEGRYFKLALPNLELAVYRTTPVPESEGGVRTYCERPVPTSYNSTLTAKGLCAVPDDAKTLVPIENLPSGVTCPEANLVKIPAKNGNIISYEGPSAENSENPKPLYRIKANVMIHGEIKGVVRAASGAEFLTNPNPLEKTKIQLRVLPNVGAGDNPYFITSMQVLENNTNKSDTQIQDDWKTTLTGALGDPCKFFNELVIPIPEKIAGKIPAGETEPQDLLPDFGVEALDIGIVNPEDSATLGHIPTAYIDDSRLYLDILAHVGLIFTE